ncbi:MAG TPA: zf-HC2 domain-containing protein, partial [Thermoanaerobaculia bacterium]|nr:zf-HC2 domain-containing protein [Thermoanaerobaculia bacterium]
MDGDKPPLDEALRELAARARRDLGAHPTPELLAAYHAGELPEDEVEQIRDHLALCPECGELLLDLA